MLRRDISRAKIGLRGVVPRRGQRQPLSTNEFLAGKKDEQKRPERHYCPERHHLRAGPRAWIHPSVSPQRRHRRTALVGSIDYRLFLEFAQFAAREYQSRQ